MKGGIAFIGGDRRFLTAADCFTDSGYDVRLFGFELSSPHHVTSDTAEEALCDARYAILPLPWTKDDLNVWMPLSTQVLPIPAFRTLSAGKIVLGGMLKSASPDWIDYFDSEMLQVMNAVPTAEGAIALAMEILPVTLHDSEVLVIGFGRVAKALCTRLKALGAYVTVVARKESDLALARSMCLNTSPVSALCFALKHSDIIFNTVPARILSFDTAKNCVEGAPLIELASSPGCIDPGDAIAAGLRFFSAPGLPGKVAPVTAGRALFTCIKNIIESRSGK